MKLDEETSKLLLETVPRTMRMIRTEMRLLAGRELSVPQFRVLVRLSRAPSSNRELAAWMGVSAPTMTRMIDKLVARGLVARKFEKDDRRQVILSCTAKGAARARAVRQKVQDRFYDKIVALPKKERETLRAGLVVLQSIIL